jgi:hypothetical protein
VKTRIISNKSGVNGRKWAPLLLVLASGVAALLPAALQGIPEGNDLPHHYRVAQSFFDSVREGDLYPGWLATSNGGYGDLSVRFYPPGLYYLLAAARALTGNWYAASLVCFALLSAAGCLGVYFWARAFLPRNAAAWAGALYAFVPCHLNDLYNAALFGQYAAAAVLPFAFAFAERVCRRGRPRDVAGLAASFALLVLTHLPLTVIGALSLTGYALSRLRRGEVLVTLGRLTLAVAAGLTASACYWVTMVAERSWLRIANAPQESWADYNRNFIFQSNVYAETIGVLWVNILAVATCAMFLPAVALLRGRREVEHRGAAKSVALLLALSFLMATPLSRPVWAALPFLQQTQFPWRWLAVTAMAGPVLVAMSVPVWAEKLGEHGRALSASVVACLLLFVALSTSFVITDASYLRREQFEAKVGAANVSPSLPDWLPVWASPRAAPMERELSVEGRSFSVVGWQAARRTFQVAEGAATRARVRTFYYPHWAAATAEGRRLETSRDADGVLLISIPGDAVTVDLTWREPPLSLVSGLLSAAGWCLIVALLVKEAEARPWGRAYVGQRKKG